jgi:hypothetical protein
MEEKNMKMSIFGRIIKNKIFFVSILFILLILIRYLNNLMIYSINYINQSYFIEKSNKYFENNDIYFEKGFVMLGLSEKEFEKACMLTSSKIMVVHSFDILYPNKYYVWNYSNEKLKFHTTWFTVELKKGLTKIVVNSNVKGDITYPDKSIVDIISSFNDYNRNIQSDVEFDLDKKSGQEIENALFNKLKNIDYLERGKFLSLYFYSAVIILMLLSIKGFKVHLACIFFVLMLILFGGKLVWSGILFNISLLSGAPQSILVKAVLLLIFAHCLKIIYEGLKNIKLLNFNEISIVTFFTLLPFVIYF